MGVVFEYLQFFFQAQNFYACECECGNQSKELLNYLPSRREVSSQDINAEAQGAGGEPRGAIALRLWVALPEPMMRTPSSLRGAKAFPML